MSTEHLAYFAEIPKGLDLSEYFSGEEVDIEAVTSYNKTLAEIRKLENGEWEHMPPTHPARLSCASWYPIGPPGMAAARHVHSACAFRGAVCRHDLLGPLAGSAADCSEA